jgi:hypothetical protein
MSHLLPVNSFLSYPCDKISWRYLSTTGRGRRKLVTKSCRITASPIRSRKRGLRASLPSVRIPLLARSRRCPFATGWRRAFGLRDRQFVLLANQSLRDTQVQRPTPATDAAVLAAPRQASLRCIPVARIGRQAGLRRLQRDSGSRTRKPSNRPLVKMFRLLSEMVPG